MYYKNEEKFYVLNGEKKTNKMDNLKI